MPNQSFSSMLRALVNDYYNHRMSFEEYRSRRKALLDDVDFYFNGVENRPKTDSSENKGEQKNAPMRLGNTQTFSASDLLKVLNKSS